MGIIAIDQTLENLGGQVGLTTSDLQAAAFQYSATFGDSWKDRLAADLLARYLDVLAAKSAEAEA